MVNPFTAAQRNCQQVILECDALQVVQEIGSLNSDPFDHGLLIEDIKTRLWDFASSRVTHVRRSANVVAHKLAKLALSPNFTSFWFEVPPKCVQDTLIHDCMRS
ncbi:hypothetical protein DVH24_027543 [Malus domestica]|uniref:RNase H type-1 domain-containing protein n=1 Tax=Malus domestica TaxID=3750 RepID=A0A498H7Q5_MALDO|nr:hypothetical protein DVH24_027543 [Malus domestica]